MKIKKTIWVFKRKQMKKKCFRDCKKIPHLKQFWKETFKLKNHWSRELEGREVEFFENEVVGRIDNYYVHKEWCVKKVVKYNG